MPTSDRSARCLLVTKEFSTTPNSGGTLRTLALLEQLATRYQTTVISPNGVLTAGPGEALHEMPVPPAAGGWFAGALEQLQAVGRYRSISGVRTAGAGLLANLRLAEGHYDVGVIDHTVLAGLADDVAVGCDQLVVSMHNIESDLMAQRTAATRPPAAKLVMRAETELLKRLQARVADRYPVVVCTEADARALPAARYPPIVCRNGIFSRSVDGEAGRTAAGRSPSSMVFSGALDWGPNVEGLLWFLAEVWPVLRGQVPEATLTIAGRNPGQSVVEACRIDGVTLLADPPVMDTVLDRHAIGIVPLLSGGGSRIKILEYLAVGLNVISTGVGASGLEDVPDALLDRLPADPTAFAAGLVARLRSPVDSAVAAQDWVRKHYTWEVTLQPLLDHLQRHA